MWIAIASMQLPKKIRTSRRRVAFDPASLLREKGRDMLVFAFFLAVSAGFWLLQKLDDTFETDISVPLELVNVPEGIIITSSLPEEVTFTVQDRGTNLFNYMRRSGGVEPLRLDFSVYDNGAAAGKASISATDVQRAFLQQMSSSTQVVRLTPSKFEFHYNRGMSRRVPVRFTGHVSTSSQNYLQDLTLSPDSVVVYAPKAILDTLRYAYTQNRSLEGLAKTTEFDVDFPRIPGVKCMPEKVRMTAHVDYYTEQSMKVPVIGLNFPADISLKTFPAEVTLKFRVGAAYAKTLTPANFVLAATYEELMLNPSQKFSLELRSIPYGVSNVRIYPSEVEYLLEHTSAEDSDQQAESGNARKKGGAK